MVAWIGYGMLAAAVAYVLGSIPTGYWLGRLLKDIDIREHGSGSTGATNVLRTLGTAPAAAALAIDLIKGVAAVAFAHWLYGVPAVTALSPAGLAPDSSRSWAMAMAGLLAVIGHSRSIWIGFAGGKSAATGLGVLVAMSWQVGLGAGIAFCIVLLLSRIVSLSSIIAAAVAVGLMLTLQQPTAFVLVAGVGAAYVIWRHRTNILRLFAGTEPRIGQTMAGVKS